LGRLSITDVQQYQRIPAANAAAHDNSQRGQTSDHIPKHGLAGVVVVVFGQLEDRSQRELLLALGVTEVRR
jgi:hypothetical protein